MSVLSFRKSVDQLDQAADSRAALQQALALCIRSAGQYAVELKAGDTRVFREHLEQLATRADGLHDAADAEPIQASFRSELRSYRDVTQKEVERLRVDLATIMESMQTFMTGVGGSTLDLKHDLDVEFQSLEAVAESGDVAAVRAAIHHAVETATRSCEEALRAQEFIAAQLQDEIRNLHKVVDHERKAALSDPTTGVWNRAKLDSRIKDLILLNEGFCVFLCGLPGLLQISSTDPRIAPEVLRALTGRLQAIAGHKGELGMVGRWSEEVFAVVFNLPLSGAPTTPEAAEQTLGGDYAVQVAGCCLDTRVEVRVRAVERPKDAPESAFFLQLGQAAFRASAR